MVWSGDTQVSPSLSTGIKRARRNGTLTHSQVNVNNIHLKACVGCPVSNQKPGDVKGPHAASERKFSRGQAS